MAQTAVPGASGASLAGGAPDRLVGFASALGAFLVWGLGPLYFHAIGAAGALEILAHRIVWTVAVIALALAVTARGRAMLAGLAAYVRSPRRLGIYAVTTLLISSNWLLFIWSALNGHLLQASLGYFIGPLLNVLLGILFLSERLNRLQAAAVMLAAAGVAVQVAAVGQMPWVALTLALSFGIYGLVRKKAAVDPVEGLLVETALIAPAALAYLIWLGGDGLFGRSAQMTGLLVLAGPITAAPLVLYMVGVQRLPFATVGLMQYLSPTLQFLLAVTVFAEPFGPSHLITFAAIWAGLALFSWDAVAGRRRRADALRPPEMPASRPAVLLPASPRPDSPPTRLPSKRPGRNGPRTGVG